MIDGRLFYYDHNDVENHVLIKKVRMEQASATSIQREDGRMLIDYNSAGNPLLEIVTES